MNEVCILGGGAWGTAVATLLARNGYAINLWCYEQSVALSIKKNRINDRYLPGIILDEKIEPMTDLDQALCGVRWVFEAIPVKYLRSILVQAKSCYQPDQIWVILSKGIEQESLLFPSQVIDEVFGCSVPKAVFAGPSFAQEVAQGSITAVCIAATDCKIGGQLQQLLKNDYFRTCIITDLIGIQVGSALKNVITLGIGMLDGAGYGENVKAFFLSQGLYEMGALAQFLGGHRETIFGLSGVGDLVLTAMGSLSKNREVGRRLATGETLDVILQKTGFIPEGINTAKSVYQLISQNKLDLPLCQNVYNVIYNQKKLSDVIGDLMEKQLEWECRVQ